MIPSLIRHLKGQVFLFDARPRPQYESAAGFRLLGIFIFLEAIIGPRLSLFTFLGLPLPPVWLRVSVLLALSLLLVKFFARLKPSQIGLFAWRDWSLTEKSFFIQALAIANVVLCFILSRKLKLIFSDSGLRGQAAIVIYTNLLWGFYQELVYRGILQTELVRRWGTVAGILVSALVFTFGPLHFYHFSRGMTAGVLQTFAAIFITGLYFGTLFRTSGNLVIVGVLHGVGNCYMDGLSNLVR